MRRTGLWWAAALVVASNLGIWGFAALNRSGEPEAVLELTERELRLPAKQAENTALTLALVFDRQGESRVPQPSEPGWFDRARLQSIGFECSRAVTPENATYYRVRPPRSTYAALEYEGEAWRRRIAEPLSAPVQIAGAGPTGTRSVTAPQESPEDRLRGSHLVVIDVGNDPITLRQRNPDRRRVAIVEATAVLQFVSNPGQPPFLTGRVTSVLPRDINVPREWLTLLARLQSEGTPANSPPSPRDPRYRVTVKWGSNFEPWIADVRLMPTADVPAVVPPGDYR